MPNQKNNDSQNYINSEKVPWVPNIGPNIRKQFKKLKKKNYFHIWEKLKKHLILKQTKATT